MQTYWSAHRLAARGHDVHVITNAKEVRPPFRMHMRPEDWRRCEAAYGDGSVTVHWTDPVDESQSYIPLASPYVTKLATLAAACHAQRPFDVVFSFYMEPYAVAGHLAAEMAGLPHVVRMAGSDSGRLWHHPQFEALYDHVLRSAAILIGGGEVARRAISRGIDPERIASLRGLAAPPDLFRPDGPTLDIPGLRAEIAAHSDREMRDLLWGGFAVDRPYFGLCGKLGQPKGTFPLLLAMHGLKAQGIDVGLVALAHGSPSVEQAFRERVAELGLTERVLQLPFLPHWRVPEFLRSCLAVCCLEQDFAVAFHTPTIPIEVMLNGNCLVGSTEVIRKLPGYQRMPDRYGCVAIPDVNDSTLLAARLAAIARDPSPIAEIGARARNFAQRIQRNWQFDQRLEAILAAAAARKTPPRTIGEDSRAIAAVTEFPLTRLALSALGTAVPSHPQEAIDLAAARRVATCLDEAVRAGRSELKPLIPGLEIELAVAAAEAEEAVAVDPLFRLELPEWALHGSGLRDVAPLRDPAVRLLRFEFDISPYGDIHTLDQLPREAPAGRSHLVAFAGAAATHRDVLHLDGRAAQILELSDGSRTAGEVAAALDGAGSGDGEVLGIIEQLFVLGLLQLRHRPTASLEGAGT